MFAVLGRLNPSYEEAAYDLGASRWQIVKDVVMPIVFPGMIAVALFGFTLSYDEFPRSWLTAGSKNTLPLEIWTMTTNVTSPALYALGTVTTVVSFVVIALALGSIILIQTQAATRDMNTLHDRDREAVQDRRTRRTRRVGRNPPGRDQQAVRHVLCRQGHQPDDPARLLLLPARPVGLRQDHHPAHDRRPRNADLGRNLSSASRWSSASRRSSAARR